MNYISIEKNVPSTALQETTNSRILACTIKLEALLFSFLIPHVLGLGFPLAVWYKLTNPWAFVSTSMLLTFCLLTSSINASSKNGMPSVKTSLIPPTTTLTPEYLNSPLSICNNTWHITLSQSISHCIVIAPLLFRISLLIVFLISVPIASLQNLVQSSLPQRMNRVWS